MESEKKGRTLELVRFVLMVLFFQEVVTPATSRKPEGGFVYGKNYYSPDPYTTPPPSDATPCPTPSRGGGHGAPSRRQPTPSHGGGGYYAPPSVPVVTTPPSPTYGPVTPAPLVPLVPPTPTYPVIPSPPATPLLPFDPNTFPFTCDYWRKHSAAIWGLIGYWGTVGQLFGPPAAAAFGRSLSLPEALANTRADGIGALYREGTASLLNSLASKSFVFSTQQVRDAFNAAVVSDKAAAAQARVFKKANEGHLKHY
ncbi:hypothetical protein OPV22_017743 [Ensete ventricosum]|uniref:Protodermal factor 1 n=1 Tax=Ensete ventricosum TaxID=4639 RepID=A0AAV8QX22_ENSVE|nr:hypothetical protein OPV22_017743 [Ensete ventricosum]